jgi:hypothetical protein
MTDTKTHAKLLSTLKRHNPSKVRAFAGDDDARDIAVPTRRQKWTQVIEAIQARAWTRVELLDKSGAVLGYVDNTEPARELEELASGVRTVNEARAIVELVIKAQRDTMTFRDAEVTALLAAQGAVVREMLASMQALTKMYQQQVEAAAEVADLNARAELGEGGNVAQLIEAAPQLLAALPMLKSLLGGGQQ